MSTEDKVELWKEALCWLDDQMSAQPDSRAASEQDIYMCALAVHVEDQQAIIDELRSEVEQLKAARDGISDFLNDESIELTMQIQGAERAGIEALKEKGK